MVEFGISYQLGRLYLIFIILKIKSFVKLRVNLLFVENI